MTTSRGTRSALVWAALAVALGIGLVAWLEPGRARAQNEPVVDPELQARIDALVAEAGTPSTSPEVLLERLDTLWEWSNAFALEGGRLPPDLPQILAGYRIVLRALLPGETPERLEGVWSFFEEFQERIDVGLGFDPRTRDPYAAVSRFIEHSVEELELKTNDPEALGRLRLSSSGPFRAGELVTLEQTWDVGSEPMRPGGGLVVLTRMRALGLQGSDPEAESYFSIRTSNPEARFVVTEPWGYWRSFIVRDTLNFRLEGAPLEKGDTVTLVYGDRSGGSPGLRLPAYSNDELMLPVYLDLEGEGNALAPAWPAFRVEGAEEIRHVNAIAPSVVGAGEPFTLLVRAEDRWRNLASGATPEWEVHLNGEPYAETAAGEGGLTKLEDLRLDEPGIYRFSVRSADGTLEGRSNPLRVDERPQMRLLWGDTHGHTGFAEGQGSPDGYYRFGRDVARLDFLSLSEHDMWMDDREWRVLQEAADRYFEPGHFTTLLGYEWSSFTELGGHHNVYFADTERRRVPIQEAPLLEELWAGLRRENTTDDVLVIPHAHQAADWRASDGELERLAEITSGHGTFEPFANRYLENGYRVGFIGSSDNHNGHPGYSGVGNLQLGGLAAVWAPSNDRQALFRALRERSTYATTGERILLDATLAGAEMGSRVPFETERQIRCRISGTAPIDTAEVIKNGAVVYTHRPLPEELSSRVRVRLAFDSSTAVFNGHRNPRGARPWRGTIEVRGARLAGVETPWFAHPLTFRVERDDDRPQRLDFSFPTRGRQKALLLELEEASDATEIVVALEESREQGGSPGAADRPPAPLPPAELGFRLAEGLDGPDVRELRVVENVDRVSMRVLPGDPARDVELTYRDQEEPRQGDFYYVRVRQVDGAEAWSSPWWMAGPAGEGPRRGAAGD